MGDGVEFKLDYPTDVQEMKLQDIRFGTKQESDTGAFFKYIQRFIKYTVKDWKGIDVPCKITGGELEDDIWWALVRDQEQALKIYTIISKELEYTESDKKK